MQKKLLFCLIHISAAIALCGCVSHDANIKKRSQFAVNREEEVYVHSRSLVFRQWGTNILSAISSANGKFESPTIASATMGKDEDGEYRLFVFWLEDKPSIDGIELYLSKANQHEFVPIDSSDIKENKKTSEVTIVMVASWVWTNTNSIWSNFEKNDDVSELKIRLLKKNKIKTDWHPVSFYRLDHWMGSKQVIEMTNGNPASIKAN
jgi:hypothetical protein